MGADKSIYYLNIRIALYVYSYFENIYSGHHFETKIHLS